MGSQRDALEAEFAVLMGDLIREGNAGERRAAIDAMRAFLIRAKALPPLDYARIKEQARMLIAHAELALSTAAFRANIEDAAAADPDAEMDELLAGQDAQMRAFLELIGHDPDEITGAMTPEARVLFDALDREDAARVRDALATLDVNGHYGEFEKTPLYHVVSAPRANLELAHLLLDLGADPAEGMADGYTPLHGLGFSTFHGTPQEDVSALVRRLVEGGADPDARTYMQGWTPVSLAVDEWNPVVVRALIEAGAEIGDELLAGAIASPEVVAVLLEAGANPHAAGPEGRSALERARAAIERDDERIADIVTRGKTPDGTERNLGRNLRASLALMEAVPRGPARRN